MSAIKLLYVDDEPDIREVATFSLEIDPQIEVRAVASGAEALALLDAGGWRPDLILLDVMMPDMDGPTTLGHIRERPGFAPTPVIFITARAQPHERAAFLEKGAIGVITKPFDPMTLAQDVRNLLAAA
jgi:two-component system, OmpR family, response regulator